MRLIPAKVLLFPLLVVFACLPQAAHACRGYRPFVIDYLRHADVVFSGRLLRYELVSPGRADEHGLLTVRVDAVFKGRVSGDVQLYWVNSTFTQPSVMEFPEPILIAAVEQNRERMPATDPSATVRRTDRPDLLHVLQRPCSSPFILPYSRDTADHIQAILREGAVEPQD